MSWLLALAACTVAPSDNADTADETDLTDTDPADTDGPFTIDESDCAWDETWEFGYEYCLRTIGDVEVKVFTPDTLEAGAPIAIYLHGDTANGYYEDWGYEWLLDWTRSNGIIFVAALAPNGCSWWRHPNECSRWIEDEDGYNSDALARVIDTVGQDWGAATDGIRYVGYSGGSTFLTGHFVPLYGKEYPGIVAAHCGGQGPIYDFTWDHRTDVVRERIPLEFTWGSRDFMGGYGGEYDYVQEAIDFYDDIGWPRVGALEIDGLGHCGASYDWDQRTIDLWEAYDG